MTHAGVVPQPAATVVLLRVGRAGLEVLLTRRPASMAFAPDMHVFPGGRVDGTDADPRLVARSALSPTRAAAGLGGDLPPDLAIASYIAAIREVFEETGVLLADATAQPSGDKGSSTIALGRFPAPESEAPAAAAPGLQPRAVSQARSALVGGDADFATVAEELDLTLRTDLLVPLSRWVTPPVLARRFDARFFAARMPAGARVSFEGDEVAGHAWMTPTAALTAMADGALAMWIPTSATLQQLAPARSLEEIQERLAPGTLGEPSVEVLSPEVTRIVMPSGGGVAGQPIASYLVGRRRFVLVDPGDPVGPGLALAMTVAAERSGAIAAVALTRVAPDHAAGAEGLAEILGIPILAGPGSGRSVPYAVHELQDLGPLPMCDVEVRAIHTPGPSPEHLAYAIAGGPVIAADLDGAIGARTIAGPVDDAALAASRGRVETIAPGATWLSAHPSAGPA